MRFLIYTSGGDAPGLNAVIQGATMTAISLGHEIYGSEHGLTGLMTGRVRRLLEQDVRDIAPLGGSILGTISKGPIFGVEGAGYPEVLAALRNQFDGLIVAGGDGSLKIISKLVEAGFPVVLVPKTIDRDVPDTYSTFGFATAVQTATGCLDSLHSTAKSHARIMVVEVMGRRTGWIALSSGVASGAHAILIPEIPYHMDALAAHIRLRESNGQHYHIIVCSEGACAEGDSPAISERTGRYSGLAERIAAGLEKLTGKESRAVSLGHLLRGGSPIASDRLLGVSFGSVAARLLSEGIHGVMVAHRPPNFVPLDISGLLGRISEVQPDTDEEVMIARMQGISFGD